MKSEDEECFETILKMLAFHGFWPQQNEDQNITILYVLWRIIRNSPIITLIFAGLVHIAEKFIFHTEENVTDDFVICFVFLFFSYVAFVFTLNQNKVVRLVQELREFSEFGKPSGLRQLIERQRKFSYAIYIYCQLGMVIYGYVSYSLMPHCKKLDSNGCGMIIPIYLPFEIHEKTKICLMIIELIVVVYQILLPGIIGSYLMLAIMQHLTLQLKQIRKDILKLSEKRSLEERTSILIECVRHHKKIACFEKMLKECYGNANAVHLFLSAIIIGILNYKIYYKMEAKDIIHMLGWIFSMVFLCHTGQDLLNESKNLSTDVYFLHWYEYEKSLKQIVQMYILRSQRPIKIEAGIFYAYSYELLVVVFQSSFSYMTVLNQLTNSKITRDNQ